MADKQRPNALREKAIAHEHDNTEETAAHNEDGLEHNTRSSMVQRSKGRKTKAPGQVEANGDGKETNVISIPTGAKASLASMAGLGLKDGNQEKQDDREEKKHTSNQE